MGNVDPEILQLCDIFCVNETEVRRQSDKYYFYPENRLFREDPRCEVAGN